jgi:S-adenosylmethionine hydrolase
MITLTTDFGYEDHYVAAMKAVIYGINPHAKIIDVTHGVKRHSIRHAAYVLNALLPYFKEAVHVFVVDPGVGTERKSIAVKIGDSWYVGPDNGIVTYVADRIDKIFEIIIQPKSTTFHGRDVFAPAAAYIDMGNFEYLEEIDSVHLFSYFKPRREGNVLEGEIIHIDVFGNVITNIPWEMVKDAKKIKLLDRFIRIVPSYGHAHPDELIALVNSENFLEFAINQGDASSILPFEVGDKISIEIQQ